MAGLLVEKAGAIATIVIDNPSRRNSVTLEMWQQWVPVLADLQADETIKVVVVRGSGDNFSAGADIRDLPSILHHPDLGEGGHITVAEAAISSFPKPTVAAIEGYCVGGGWEIAAACDIRFASESATFGITPSRIGIIYPVSGIERLVSVAGPAVAKYMLYSGDLLSASTAYEYGMLSRVIAPDSFDAEVAAFADRLAGRSQLSIQGTKRIVDAIAAGGSDTARVSAHWQDELAASDDPAIGAAAFLARETPVFRWTAPKDGRG